MLSWLPIVKSTLKKETFSSKNRFSLRLKRFFVTPPDPTRKDISFGKPPAFPWLPFPF